VLITSGYKRYDSRLNLEHKANKFLFGLNFSTSYTRDNVVPVGFSTNEEGSALYAARGFNPTLSIYDENGDYQISPLINLDNPLAFKLNVFCSPSSVSHELMLIDANTVEPISS